MSDEMSDGFIVIRRPFWWWPGIYTAKILNMLGLTRAATFVAQKLLDAVKFEPTN